MKKVRGLSGFGDAIYLRVAVEWLLKHRPDNYLILNNYPTIFQDLPVQVTTFNRRTKVDYDFSYLSGKDSPNTHQFEDMFINAKIKPVKFTSKLKNRKYSDKVIVIKWYPPFGQQRGSANNILAPDEETYNSFIDIIRRKNHDVMYIEPGQRFDFLELVKIFNKAKLVVCQVGWGIPMAEMLDVPLLVCFNQRSLRSENAFIRKITPQKVLAKSHKNSRFVIL